MPKPYPQELGDDDARVTRARVREVGVTPAQIAKNFCIHEKGTEQVDAPS